MEIKLVRDVEVLVKEIAEKRSENELLEKILVNLKFVAEDEDYPEEFKKIRLDITKVLMCSALMDERQKEVDMERANCIEEAAIAREAIRKLEQSRMLIEKLGY